MSRVALTKQEVRRALVALHTKQGSLEEVFARLRSVQFDPLSPAGSNHDLVLQARVPGYKIGDWQKIAYEDRLVYDGWDKMACLIPFTGWTARKVLHTWRDDNFEKIFKDHPHAVDAVLDELERRGPLLPKDFEFQEKKPEWRGSWFGPNLTKQTLRALWHTGKVMTHSRKGQHHVYDLTERIVPPEILSESEMTEPEAVQAMLFDRYSATGFIRPTAPYEIWCMAPRHAVRRAGSQALLDQGKLVEIDVEGMVAHATVEFVESVGLAKPKNRVTIFGPLDQIMWDRKMINQVFGFDYVWEVYKPESLRKWGYYVLPVLYGDRFVARFDVWAREGVLEIRSWHWEPGEPADAGFWPAFEEGMLRFMAYCGAKKVTLGDSADRQLKRAVKGLKLT